MVLHSPRKRAPERAWGFESLALRLWDLRDLLYPSSQELVGFFIGSVKAELLADRKTLALKAFHWQIDQVRTLW
mgnify:CR=1 FL=1